MTDCSAATQFFHSNASWTTSLKLLSTTEQPTRAPRSMSTPEDVVTGPPGLPSPRRSFFSCGALSRMRWLSRTHTGRKRMSRLAESDYRRAPATLITHFRALLTSVRRGRGDAGRSGQLPAHRDASCSTGGAAVRKRGPEAEDARAHGEGFELALLIYLRNLNASVPLVDSAIAGLWARPCCDSASDFGGSQCCLDG